ncbi:MAG TPA: hypothetical protein VJT31_01110 [Rugosimonospora sp.]|nr:hypothetical protein [Rugosimonospora sp.]
MSAVRAGWIVAVVLLLAACSRTAGTQASAADPVPATAISSDPPSGHPLGQAVDADHSFMQVTVYEYRQPVAQGAPAPNPGDYTWGAADVQTCASAALIFDASVSSVRWMLVYADQTEVQSARVTHAQFPKPRYPVTQRTLKPGECVRGWIVFPVPAGAEPALIRYTPVGAPPVDWTATPAG